MYTPLPVPMRAAADRPLAHEYRERQAWEVRESLKHEEGCVENMGETDASGKELRPRLVLRREKTTRRVVAVRKAM